MDDFHQTVQKLELCTYRENKCHWYFTLEIESGIWTCIYHAELQVMAHTTSLLISAFFGQSLPPPVPQPLSIGPDLCMLMQDFLVMGTGNPGVISR